MKKNMKSFIILLFLLSMSIAVLGGCKKETEELLENKKQTTKVEVEKKSDDLEDASVKKESDITTDDISEDEKTPILPETKDLTIYGIHSESLESEQVSVSIPKDSEITPQYIVEQVVSLFAENSLIVGIESVTEEEDKVIVSFESDKAPLVNVGSGVEATILDSLSMSLLDNLKTCNKVIFQVEGNAYESGHIILEKDEIYKWK